MSLKYQRPNDTYAGDTSLSNRNKYQNDATAEPKVAISSQKVDGDFNYLIDVLNQMDQASGSRASIDDRLSVALNDDGTLKSSVVATFDDWLNLAEVNPARVNDTTFQVDGDVTALLAAGQRVRLTVGGLDVFANVKSAAYTGSVTQVVCGEIVNSGGSSVTISENPTTIAYAPLTVGKSGNSRFQYDALQVRAADPVMRLKKESGTEFGLKLGTDTLDFVKNTGTEEVPTWAVQGQVSASGLVVGDSTVTLAKLADGTAGKCLGFDGAGSPAELDFPVIVASGCVMAYAGPVTPSGWLLCDGSAVSRTGYAALFAAIGTAYGTGDGSTTFNLPDMRGRTVFGLDTMGGTAADRVTEAVSGIDGTTLGASGGHEAMQTHSHTITDPGHVHAFGSSETTPRTGGGSGNVQSALGSEDTESATTGITVDESGDGDSQNMPPAMMMNWIIKA